MSPPGDTPHPPPFNRLLSGSDATVRLVTSMGCFRMTHTHSLWALCVAMTTGQSVVDMQIIIRHPTYVRNKLQHPPTNDTDSCTWETNLSLHRCPQRNSCWHDDGAHNSESSVARGSEVTAQPGFVSQAQQRVHGPGARA